VCSDERVDEDDEDMLLAKKAVSRRSNKLLLDMERAYVHKWAKDGSHAGI
jgi:hypothetical protein